MADLSKGRGDGSVLAGQRLPLFWPWHSQGETKVTAPAVTDLANAEPIAKAASRAGNRAPFTTVSWIERAYTTSTSILETWDFRSFARTSASSFLGSIFAGM